MNYKKDEGKPEIIKGPLGSISIYEITDYELEILQGSSSDSIILNFAIFFLTTAFTLFVGYSTGVIPSENLKIIYLISITIGMTAGVVLIIWWYKTKQSSKEIVKKIKKRIKKSPPNTK